MNDSKIHPSLLPHLQTASIAEMHGIPHLRVIVTVKRSRQPVMFVNEQLGKLPQRHLKLTNATALITTRREIDLLSEHPDTAMIYLDEPVRAFLSESVPQIHANAVWRAGYFGTGVRVAIVDTGIDATHPDLRGRIIAQKDFTGEGDGDGVGHGTHVASIVGGGGLAGEGRFAGVAPECAFYVYKVLDANGSGLMSDVMAGVDAAVADKCQVINLSLGGDGSSDGSDALSLHCDAAVDRGAVVCVAAGNEGPSARTIGSPGAAKKVITVGAVSKSDGLEYFSSRGPTADGRTKPDIVLPGGGIVAARAAGTRMGEIVDEYYVRASGTSMATPHASGIAALLLQAKPDLTPYQIKTIMRLHSKLLPNYGPNEVGDGRADALAAYQAIGQAPPPEPTPPQGDGCSPLAWLVNQYVLSGKEIALAEGAAYDLLRDAKR